MRPIERSGLPPSLQTSPNPSKPQDPSQGTVLGSKEESISKHVQSVFSPATSEQLLELDSSASGPVQTGLNPSISH